MLTSRQPIWIGWGDELDLPLQRRLSVDHRRQAPVGAGPADAAKCGARSGATSSRCCSTALGGVEGTYVEEQFLIMERNGYPEETYYTFSYSPIPDANGAPGGIICANTDDTRRVIGRAASCACCANSPQHDRCALAGTEACERSAIALDDDPRDIPFALLYTKTQDCDMWSLAGATGFGEPPSRRAFPKSDLKSASSWPLAMACRTRSRFVRRALPRASARPLPTGGWDRPCNRAAIFLHRLENARVAKAG